MDLDHQGFLSAINEKGQTVGSALKQVQYCTFPYPAPWKQNGKIDAVGRERGNGIDINENGAFTACSVDRNGNNVAIMINGTRKSVICGGYATGINNKMQVVGYSQMSTYVQPWVWTEKYGTKNIPTLAPGKSAFPSKINDASTAVGWAEDENGSSVGVIWKGNCIIRADDLMSDDDRSRYQIIAVNDLNERGDFCGSVYGSTEKATRAFLLKKLP